MAGARGAAIRLACVGHASLDHVFEIEAFAPRPSKTPARRYRMQAGGMAFNAAVSASRLGAAVRMIGRVGDDSAADFLRRRLAEERIDPAGLQTVPHSATSVSAVVVDALGQRQIFNHRGDALARAHALDVSQLEGADAVLVDPRWVAGAEAALTWARERGVLSMLDADVAPPADLARLVPLARWTVFSEPGLACWAPGQETQAALRAACRGGCEVAVVTWGEHGSWRSTGGGDPLHEPAPAVTAADTTAAGDVFHAALAVALAEGRPADAAVRWASAAAAFKCERGLGALGAPTRHQLEVWLGARTT